MKCSIFLHWIIGVGQDCWTSRRRSSSLEKVPLKHTRLRFIGHPGRNGWRWWASFGLIPGYDMTMCGWFGECKKASCCSPVSGSLFFFLPCKSDLFALWRQFGQPAGIMTLCEAYANSCFDRTYVGALQVFWHFNAFPKSAEVLLVENLLCFAWNCNQTGYCCISFRIMWLSVMFIAFFVILLTCPRCPSLDFWLPSIPPCNSQADAPVLEAETQQWWVQAWMLCVCFWNFLLRPFRIYTVIHVWMGSKMKEMYLTLEFLCPMTWFGCVRVRWLLHRSTIGWSIWSRNDRHTSLSPGHLWGVLVLLSVPYCYGCYAF